VVNAAPPARAASSYPAALAVCAANVLAYFAIGVVAPILPIYMRSTLAASDFSIAIVMASYAVTTLAGRPAGGLWGDRRGFRAPAATGALLIIFGTAAYGVGKSVAWLLLCRLVVGLGEGLSQASCISWAIALAPPPRRPALLSYAGVSGWGGVALGAMVGDALVARVGAGASFWAGAAAPLLGLAIVLAVPPAAREANPRLSLAGVASVLARPGAAYALATVGYAAVLTFGSLLMQENGQAPAFLLRAFVAGIIGLRVAGANLPARLGPNRTAALCAAMQAAAFFALACLSKYSLAVAVGGFIGGMAFGLSFPSVALYALERVSEGDRGLALGVISAFFDVGMALSGVILGWVAARGGYAATFLVAACCAALAAMVIRARPSEAGLVSGAAP
jgi:MFS family permease